MNRASIRWGAALALLLPLALGMAACGDDSSGSKGESKGSGDGDGDGDGDGTGGDTDGAPPEPGDEPPAVGMGDEQCDAGDRAWVERTLPYLLGRKPESSREVDVLVSMIEQLDDAGEDGRGIVARGLASGDAYLDRWETFFYEQTRVNRIETKANVPCYAQTTAAADDEQLAAFIRDNGAQGSGFGGFPTMRDVLRSSLRLDDITPYYRADMFARMARPLSGANVSAKDLDLMRRTNYGEIFENAYLGRTTLCLQCHNSDTAVTYSPDPALNRHWPITGHFEKAIWGDHEGRPEDELFAVFRWNGFADAGTTQPWGLAASCGQFATDRSGDLWGTPAHLAGDLPAGAQLFDLDPKLRDGFDSLYQNGLLLEGNDDLSEHNQALAYLTAANIANALWEEATGHKLVLSNRFPRNDAQREILQDLTEAFIATGYSPRELLVEITTHPLYNQAAPEDCETTLAYPLDPVFDPFSPASSDPNAQGNSAGDTVHRHTAWVLMDAAAQSMWWPRPDRWGGQNQGGTYPPDRVDFLESQGVFLKDSKPGSKGVDFYGMLSWEQEMARGQNPGLGGACTGPLTGGCAPEDWPSALTNAALASPDATVRDVALAVKDRLLADAGIEDAEIPHIEAIMSMDLDARVGDVSPTALETGVRRYAGLLLNTPQYMLANIASRGRREAIELVVPGTSTNQLCTVLAAQVLDPAGKTYTCSNGGLTID